MKCTWIRLIRAEKSTSFLEKFPNFSKSESGPSLDVRLCKPMATLLCPKLLLRSESIARNILKRKHDAWSAESSCSEWRVNKAETLIIMRSAFGYRGMRDLP